MIDCKSIANEIKEELKKEISSFPSSPGLAIIQIGDNAASNRYINGKLKDAQELGINANLYKFDESLSTEDIITKIQQLNNDDTVHGIIIQLPIKEKSLLDIINIKKDVDGFLPNSPFIQATPLGVLRLLEKLNCKTLTDKNVVLIGYGDLVNKPLFKILSDAGANVTVCRSKVSERNLSYYCRNANIIITATGKYGVVNRSCVSNIFNPSCIIIDCGISIIDGKQYGDCDKEVYNIHQLTTPRINGMGLMTRISLMENVVKAYKISKNI